MAAALHPTTTALRPVDPPSTPGGMGYGKRSAGRRTTIPPPRSGYAGGTGAKLQPRSFSISEATHAPESEGPVAGRIVIVGGGPGGLMFARKARDLGFDVTVLETGMPYGAERAADERSFNLTVDGLGMHAAGKMKGLIYAAGRIIDGRAIHVPDEPVLTHPYGHNATDHFVAVSRKDLLNTFASSFDDDSFCRIHFGCTAIDCDTRGGVLTWTALGSRVPRKETFDLIVFADGVNGLGRELAMRTPGISEKKIVEPITYLKAEISAQAAAKCQIPLDKINFWPGKGGVTIAVPNVDDTASALVMGELPGGFDKPVFDTAADAMRFMRMRNPLLLEAIPDLPAQLVGRRRGHFVTTETSNWCLGPKAVLLGDAGRCAPPWAGLGANSAFSDAEVLARCLAKHHTQEAALGAYSKNRIAASAVIQRLVSGHGRLLNVSLGSRAWRLAHGLQDLRERVFGARSLYQQIAFDKGGLDKLIEQSVN